MRKSFYGQPEEYRCVRWTVPCLKSQICESAQNVKQLGPWPALLHYSMGVDSSAHRQEVQEVEQRRVQEKQALKQKEEEAEMRWHQRQRHDHEQLSLKIERPWTIAALSLPEHAAVCEHPAFLA